MGLGVNSAGRRPDDDLAELKEIAKKIKPFPEKTRKMFKQALQELEGDKMSSSESIPMSRPRIRLLLSQMNANDLEERHKSLKFPKEVLLTGMPGKAERDMFGKMVLA